ncbi:hypothetical protein VPH35_046337 [Triticum aestivum]
MAIVGGPGHCRISGWLRFFVKAWSWWCGRPSVPGFATSSAWRCGDGGVRLLGLCRQVPRGVKMCDARMKVLHGDRRAGGGGTCGCHSPLSRRPGTFVISIALSELVHVSERKPRFGVGSARWWRPRHRSFVGSIVCGDTVVSLSSSSARRCPFLILGGAMYGRHRCFQDSVFFESD